MSLIFIRYLIYVNSSSSDDETSLSDDTTTPTPQKVTVSDLEDGSEVNSNDSSSNISLLSLSQPSSNLNETNNDYRSSDDANSDMERRSLQNENPFPPSSPSVCTRHSHRFFYIFISKIALRPSFLCNQFQDYSTDDIDDGYRSTDNSEEQYDEFYNNSDDNFTQEGSSEAVGPTAATKINQYPVAVLVRTLILLAVKDLNYLTFTAIEHMSTAVDVLLLIHYQFP